MKQIRNINLSKFIDNPDYLVVNVIKDDHRHVAEQVLYNMLFINTIALLNREKLLDKLLLNTYGITTLGILTLQDEVLYNGDTCILGNFNIIGNIGHAISGITCNNNRYVYNGTFKNRGTSANHHVIVKRSQCDLMKFPWNIRQENKFCLNPRFCNLDLTEETAHDKLCFSFNDGPRTLIYVKKQRMRSDKSPLDIYKNASNISSPFVLPSPNSLSNGGISGNMAKFIADIKNEIEKIERKTKRRKI